MRHSPEQPATLEPRPPSSATSRLRPDDLWDMFGDVHRLNELTQDLRDLSKEERQALYGSMLQLFEGLSLADLNPTNCFRRCTSRHLRAHSTGCRVIRYLLARSSIATKLLCPLGQRF